MVAYILAQNWIGGRTASEVSIDIVSDVVYNTLLNGLLIVLAFNIVKSVMLPKQGPFNKRL